MLSRMAVTWCRRVLAPEHDLPELVSGLVEQLVVLGSALSCPGLGPVGSVGDWVAGEYGEEVVEENPPARAADGGEHRGPFAHG